MLDRPRFVRLGHASPIVPLRLGLDSLRVEEQLSYLAVAVLLDLVPNQGKRSFGVYRLNSEFQVRCLLNEGRPLLALPASGYTQE